MWGLNEMGPEKHLRRSRSQRSGGVGCTKCVSGSLSVSSWVDESQLNSELPPLSGEMCESQALKSPRIKVSGEFGKSLGEKVQGRESS